MRNISSLLDTLDVGDVVFVPQSGQGANANTDRNIWVAAKRRGIECKCERLIAVHPITAETTRIVKIERVA